MRFAVLLSILLLHLLAGCAAPGTGASAGAEQKQSSISQAEYEATAIIAQAQATALVLKAQAQATALVERAMYAAGEPSEATPPPGKMAPDGSSTDVSSEDAGEVPEREESTRAAEIPAVPTMLSTPTDSGAYQVELVGVGYAAEGNLIIVQFKATRKAVNDFWPGRVSVTDETSGTVYNEVPTMPVVGLLIGRPTNPGQVGYVMFTNTPPGLPPGSIVTVKLGRFEQKHVPVSKNIE